MPTIDLSDDEHAAVVVAVRRSLADDPRVEPLKSVLAKLDPASVPKPAVERSTLPPGDGASLPLSAHRYLRRSNG